MSSREGYHWQSRPWQPSELQERVLEGVARGLTNAEIAAEVGISPDGVKWHVSRVLAETGLEGRSNLALWWQSPGHDVDFRMHALLAAGNSAPGQPIQLQLGFIRGVAGLEGGPGPLRLVRLGDRPPLAADSCPSVQAGVEVPLSQPRFDSGTNLPS
jgi:DNA-binding CsgD family transcriptional regulator